MNWTRIKEGKVELVHLSTSSIVELIFTKEEQQEQGGEFIEFKESIYMDYDHFENLKKAIQEISK